jgi:hypothetical protein
VDVLSVVEKAMYRWDEGVYQGAGRGGGARCVDGQQILHRVVDGGAS